MSPFSHPASHPARSSRIRSFLISAAALCLLSSPAAAATIELGGVLDGAQANAGAGTGSTATGVVNIMLDDVTNEMTWSASFSGLLSTYVFAHFRGPAWPNQNAGIQVGVSFDTDVAQVNGTSNGTALACIARGRRSGR